MSPVNISHALESAEPKNDGKIGRRLFLGAMAGAVTIDL